MRGEGSGSGAQGEVVRQSNSEGQAALKENCTLESRGSKPAGGLSLPPPATRARLYMEKSPGVSTITERTSPAAVTLTMSIFLIRSPPRIRMLSAVSTGAPGGTPLGSPGNG